MEISEDWYGAMLRPSPRLSLRALCGNLTLQGLRLIRAPRLLPWDLAVTSVGAHYPRGRMLISRTDGDPTRSASVRTDVNKIVTRFGPYTEIVAYRANLAGASITR